MDVVTVFFYGYLDELIYVEQSHLFVTIAVQVYRLKKTLYGLRQSAQIQYQTLVNFLTKLGFYRLEQDHDVFVSEDR